MGHMEKIFLKVCWFSSKVGSSVIDRCSTFNEAIASLGLKLYQKNGRVSV